MTELTQADYRQVLDEWCADCLHFYDGGNYFEIPDRHMNTIRQALTLAARVPQTMDAPILVDKPVSVGCAATREDAESGASFDCGELGQAIKKMEELYDKELYPYEWDVIKAAKLYRTQANITDDQIQKAANVLSSWLSGDRIGTAEGITRTMVEAAWGLK